MSKKKRKVKPEKRMLCDRCRMVTPHLLLKHTSSNLIERGRIVQCKQCKEKTLINLDEV